MVAGSDAPMPPSDRLKAAVMAASAGALNQAEHELEDLLEEPTVRDWALYDLAMLHLRSDDLERAAGELRQAVESEDAIIGPNAAFHLAHIAHLRGERQEEQRWLERVSPDSTVGSSASLNRAALEFDRGEVTAAADAAWVALIRADAITERLFALAMLARIHASNDPQFARRCLRALGAGLFPRSDMEPEARRQLLDMATLIRREMQEAIRDGLGAAASISTTSEQALLEGLSFRDQVHGFLGGSRYRPLSRSANPPRLIAVIRPRRLRQSRDGFDVTLRHRTVTGLLRDERLVDRSRSAPVLLFESVDSRRVRYLGDFRIDDVEREHLDLRLALRASGAEPPAPRTRASHR